MRERRGKEEQIKRDWEVEWGRIVQVVVLVADDSEAGRSVDVPLTIQNRVTIPNCGTEYRKLCQSRISNTHYLIAANQTNIDRSFCAGGERRSKKLFCR
jgi:hypothetical protein